MEKKPKLTAPSPPCFFTFSSCGRVNSCVVKLVFFLLPAYVRFSFFFLFGEISKLRNPLINLGGGVGEGMDEAVCL